MKRIIIITGIVVVVGGLFAQLRFRQWKNKQSGSDLTAVGLRGTSKITKPLSTIQKERLEKHFLERPPSAHVAPHQRQNAPVGTVTEVDTLNSFNNKQKS